MAKKQQDSNHKAERMIPLKVDTHRRLRVQAAEEDVTIQDRVTALIEQTQPSDAPRRISRER